MSPETVWKSRQANNPTRGTAVPPFAEHIPKLVWDILSARGLDSDESIQKWLSPNLKGLRDPFTLTDMDKAIERLVLARTRDEKIVVYADYDLDGTSALALLLKAFDWMGFTKVSGYQPKRLSEGYGLHTDAIEKLHAAGNTLMVSVDLGITAIDEVEAANRLGLDVIITDHHLPKETLPKALAVINPNRGNCTSSLGHLCGTGVAFYLVLALRRTLLERGVITEAFDPKGLLDCFAIGTLTDMVPLIDENRVLVKHGLLQLAQTKRPGLRVLMQALGLWGNPLTSSDVAIRFAPKLNALSRMEMGIQPIDLYLVETEAEAHALVDRVLMNNQDRQASQKNAETEASNFLKGTPPGASIFVYSKNFHRGVVGLVATKLCQEYGLPAFIGSLTENDGKIVGSVRMPEGRGLNALDAMAFASSALEQFGGHAVAAGFELKLENVDLFRERLETYFSQFALQAEAKVWTYDTEATLADLSPSFMSWYESLSPFGAQFSAPVFHISSVRLHAVKELKGGHFRLTLQDGATSRVALWFSPSSTHPAIRSGLTAGLIVDVLVEPQWNYFAGNKTLQLMIQDLKLSKRSQP